MYYFYTVMKLVLISDTHGLHSKMKHPIPEGDLLIHAGDLTNVGKKHEVYETLDWLKSLAKNYTFGVVFIAGNHDRSFDPKYYREHEDYDLWLSHADKPNRKPEWLTEALCDLGSNVVYLENSSVTFNKDGKDYKIWGSPVTPWFGGEYWAFNMYRGATEIGQVWKNIPLDVDVVVTHGPAFGYGDYIDSFNPNVGCEDLKMKLEEIKPRLVVCGHIHEGYGVSNYHEHSENSTMYVNASICDYKYDPINEPIVVEL
jgi:Icc-related predicted phosphoesterase